MNYYQKYLKYKTKYLNLLKGGTVPHINCDLLPFEKNDINIIYQGRIILKNNEDNNNNFLLNDNYQFEKTNIPINQSLFNILNLSMLANLNVKLGCEFIPFHIGSLQFNFYIIIGIIEYVNYTTNIKISELEKDKENKKKLEDIKNSFKQYISKRIFNINETNNNFIGISYQNSILNCFSFFNKLYEILNYLLLNDYNEQTINKLFPNIENIRDFYNIYSSFYKKKK